MKIEKDSRRYSLLNTTKTVRLVNKYNKHINKSKALRN